MIFARVTGSVVCTQKDEKLVGCKLLLVQPVDLAGAPKGNPIVAVDSVGAGERELVLLVQGSSARQTSRTQGNPVDAVIFAIVDTVEQGGKAVFRKAEDKDAGGRDREDRRRGLEAAGGPGRARLVEPPSEILWRG